MDINFVKELTHYCNISVKSCLAIEESKISYYDFTFVLAGSMTYIIDGKTFVINKNDAIFLKPGTQRARLSGREPCAYVSFNFRAEEGVSFPFGKVLRNCISPEIKRLSSVFPHSHIPSGGHSKEKLSFVLGYIITELEEILSHKSKNRHVLDILRYINENVTQNLSLAVISEKMGLSKEHVSSLFRKETGITLTDFINSQKLALAKDLIMHGEMSLTDVSSHLGFENYNYFSRIFKKKFGVSPVFYKNSSAEK